MLEQYQAISNHQKRIFVVMILFLLSTTIGCADTKRIIKQPPQNAIIAHSPEISVGDYWIFMANDWFTNKYVVFRNEVIAVYKDKSADILWTGFSDGTKIKINLDKHGRITTMFDAVDNRIIPYRKPPAKRLFFPLWVGKKWSDRYKGWNIKNQRYYEYKNDYQIVSLEEVQVKAGKFMAYKIVRYNYNINSGKTWISIAWYSPAVKFYIKREEGWGESMELLDYYHSQQ